MDENVEYKIPEAEEVSIQQQDQDMAGGDKKPPATKKYLEFLKNIDKRKVILPLGVLLITLFVYKAFQLHGARKVQLVRQQKMQTQEVAKAESGITESSAVNHPVKLITPEVGGSNQDYDTLKQNMAQLEANTHQNNAKLNGLSSAVGTMRDNIAIIDNNVRQVSDVLQQELAQVERIRQSLVKPIKSRKIKQPKLIKYYIRALVPGRAWIETADGRYSKTIKVGDELNGYGAVDYILYKEGMILMSNGSYITYGDNDN